MKYLMSFHNDQGMNNIIPLVEYLSSNDKNKITILDLRSIYAQSLSELKTTDNISVIREKSIFKNIRNLSKINKFIFFITKFSTLKKFQDENDLYIFSPGGFYEGLLSKEFCKRNKNTYFIEAGVKIYLYLSSQNNLKPKKSFLKNISGYFTTGEDPKNKLNVFVDQKNKIYNFGVPRYSGLITSNKNFTSRKPQNIKNLLYLTSAASYHNIGWEDSWQSNTISDIVNSNIAKKYILNIKVHPRDDISNYQKYKDLDNVNILYETDIETDIVNNDCIISGPSSSIHEVSFLNKVYIILWPFDDYENDYLSNESLVKNIDALDKRISKLDNDLKFQNNLFSNQLLKAKRFINIDSDSSTKNIIEHIINESKGR